MRSLLVQGADPNHYLYWTTDWCGYGARRPPLHEACRKGNLEITRALVSGGADVEITEKQARRTAFHWACWGGHMEIVVYLLQDVKCRIGKCVSVVLRI